MRSEHAIILIGGLAPLSRPGWREAGQHLVAGLKLGVRRVNQDGGVDGRSIELLVRDTAADPMKGALAVEELSRLGVVALVGEYHSVVARTVAERAEALGIPCLCSSAVIDNLTENSAHFVARLAPPQSRGWQAYAAFLLDSGHRRIAVAAEPGIYWASGTSILRECITSRGGQLIELGARALDATSLCDELARQNATMLLLLTGFPEPAVSIVRAVRGDDRLGEVQLGAPAGQPEFTEWTRLLGEDGEDVPFLRYLPDRLGPLGEKVRADLAEELGCSPSFVALEGYDSMIALASMLRTHCRSPRRDESIWEKVDVEGTRGRIKFTRVAGVSAWQWTAAPIQIVSRDTSGCMRILSGSGKNL